jgi:ubiquinone/menaquinone biosynthesis C-methylase UbiE
MALIFNSDSIALYEAWYRSASGKTMEKMVNHSFHTLLDAKPGERVLDIGCGLGNHLILLSRLGLNISGLDASPLAIEQARQRLGHACDLRIGLAQDLPYDDNEFDLAVMVHTLEFLDDPLEAIKEAARVARRGIFIGILNSFSWSCLSNKFRGIFRDSPFNQAKYYNLLQIKYLLSATLGNVPIQWICSQNWPSYYGRLGNLLSGSQKMQHCPFGIYLGLYAPLHPRVATLLHPLRIKMKKAPQSLVNGISRDKADLGF